MCLWFSFFNHWPTVKIFVIMVVRRQAYSMVSCFPILKLTPENCFKMTIGDGFMLHFALLKLIGNCLACSASNLESCFVATFFWLPSEKCMGRWKRVCTSLQANFCLLTPALTISSGSTPPNILVEFCINLVSWPDTSPLFMNHKTFPSFWKLLYVPSQTNMASLRMKRVILQSILVCLIYL